MSSSNFTFAPDLTRCSSKNLSAHSSTHQRLVRGRSGDLDVVTPAVSVPTPYNMNFITQANAQKQSQSLASFHGISMFNGSPIVRSMGDVQNSAQAFMPAKYSTISSSFSSLPTRINTNCQNFGPALPIPMNGPSIPSNVVPSSSSSISKFNVPKLNPKANQFIPRQAMLKPKSEFQQQNPISLDESPEIHRYVKIPEVELFDIVFPSNLLASTPQKKGNFERTLSSIDESTETSKNGFKIDSNSCNLVDEFLDNSLDVEPSTTIRSASSESSFLSREHKESRFKTRFCHYKRDLGVCQFGEFCLFAHDEKELRASTPTANYRTKSFRNLNSKESIYKDRRFYMQKDQVDNMEKSLDSEYYVIEEESDFEENISSAFSPLPEELENQWEYYDAVKSPVDDGSFMDDFFKEEKRCNPSPLDELFKEENFAFTETLMRAFDHIVLPKQSTRSFARFWTHWSNMRRSFA